MVGNYRWQQWKRKQASWFLRIAEQCHRGNAQNRQVSLEIYIWRTSWFWFPPCPLSSSAWPLSSPFTNSQSLLTRTSSRPRMIATISLEVNSNLARVQQMKTRRPTDPNPWWLSTMCTLKLKSILLYNVFLLENIFKAPVWHAFANNHNLKLEITYIEVKFATISIP